MQEETTWRVPKLSYDLGTHEHSVVKRVVTDYSILQRAFLNSEYVLNCRTSVSSAGLFD